MAYDEFGPVVRWIPTAIRASERFDVDPRVLIGILLLEGAGREHYPELSGDWEKFQVIMGQPDPSIGIGQMKLSTFKQTTLRHVSNFGRLPRGASNEAGWRAAFLHRLQREAVAVRYSAAYLHDLASVMRPVDRANPGVLAATYNAGLSRYQDVYIERGSFMSSVDTYRRNFEGVLPWVDDILA